MPKTNFTPQTPTKPSVAAANMGIIQKEQTETKNTPADIFSKYTSNPLTTPKNAIKINKFPLQSEIYKNRNDLNKVSKILKNSVKTLPINSDKSTKPIRTDEKLSNWFGYHVKNLTHISFSENGERFLTSDNKKGIGLWLTQSLVPFVKLEENKNIQKVEFTGKNQGTFKVTFADNSSKNYNLNGEQLIPSSGE